MSQAEQDVELRTRLLLEVSSAGGPLDVSSYRRSLSDALKSGSANRRDDALAWAERGLMAFDDTDHQMRGDSRLDDVALAGWSERGRSAKVDDLVWRRFSDAPNLERYPRLERWTTESGTWGEHGPVRSRCSRSAARGTLRPWRTGPRRSTGTSPLASRHRRPTTT